MRRPPRNEQHSRDEYKGRCYCQHESHGPLAFVNELVRKRRLDHKSNEVTGISYVLQQCLIQVGEPIEHTIQQGKLRLLRRHVPATTAARTEGPRRSPRL